MSRFVRPAAPSLTIDSAAVAAGQSFDVINPATGERFASAPDASPAQLDTAFEAAARAFRTWRTDDDAAGAKWSGLGVEAGELGLDAYTDVRVLHRAK